MKPLELVCATCHQQIAREEDGWVEWLVVDHEDDEPRSYGARLVHAAIASPEGRGACQYNQRSVFVKYGATVRDLSLVRYLSTRSLLPKSVASF